MPQKNKSLLYIFGSIILIFAAIIVTALIQKTSGPASEDIRARAGIKNTLRFTGIVVSIDTTRGTFVINNVQFENAAPGSTPLGKWTVTPPPTFSLTSLFTGVNVTISVDASTFKITNHTVTATEIKINR